MSAEDEPLVEMLAAALFDLAERRARSFARWGDSLIADWRREEFRSRAQEVIDQIGMVQVGWRRYRLPDSATWTFLHLNADPRAWNDGIQWVIEPVFTAAAIGSPSVEKP